MNKLTLAIAAVIIIFGNIFSLNSQALSFDDDVRPLVKSFLSDDNNLALLTIPRDKNKLIFYTLCDSIAAQYIIGYEGGICAALSINSTGRVDYIPMKVRSVKFGAAAALTMRLYALHRIRGVHSFKQIDGFYMFLNSGGALVAAVQENYFTKKIGFNIIGNFPEADSSVGLGEVNLISLGILRYSTVKGVDVRAFQLTDNQIAYILYNDLWKR